MIQGLKTKINNKNIYFNPKSITQKKLPILECWHMCLIIYMINLEYVPGKIIILGSIIFRYWKYIHLLFSISDIYRPIMSIFILYCGTISASYFGASPYLRQPPLDIWHVFFLFIWYLTSDVINYQWKCCFIVDYVLSLPECSKYTWYTFNISCYNTFCNTILPLWHINCILLMPPWQVWY